MDQRAWHGPGPGLMCRNFLVSMWPLSRPVPALQLDAVALFAQGTDLAQSVCLKILSAAPGGYTSLEVTHAMCQFIQ